MTRIEVSNAFGLLLRWHFVRNCAQLKLRRGRIETMLFEQLERYRTPQPGTEKMAMKWERPRAIGEDGKHMEVERGVLSLVSSLDRELTSFP